MSCTIGFVGFGGRFRERGGRCFCLQLVKPFENHCVDGGALAFGGFGNEFPGDGVFLEGGWLLLVGHRLAIGVRMIGHEWVGHEGFGW